MTSQSISGDNSTLHLIIHLDLLMTNVKLITPLIFNSFSSHSFLVIWWTTTCWMWARLINNCFINLCTVPEITNTPPQMGLEFSEGWGFCKTKKNSKKCNVPGFIYWNFQRDGEVLGKISSIRWYGLCWNCPMIIWSKPGLPSLWFVELSL